MKRVLSAAAAELARDLEGAIRAGLRAAFKKASAPPPVTDSERARRGARSRFRDDA